MVPDSDAHRAGLQEGDQVLSVNDVDFQDIEHSRVIQSKLRSIQILIINFLKSPSMWWNIYDTEKKKMLIMFMYIFTFTSCGWSVTCSVYSYGNGRLVTTAWELTGK